MTLDRPLIWFDLEATDSDPLRSRIVELYAVKIHPSGDKQEMHLLINPQQDIQPGALDKHGYTNERLSVEPTFAEVSQDVYDFFKDCDLAGYNILSYDIPLLTEELFRNGLIADFSIARVIDPLHIWRELEPRNLEAAYKLFTGKVLEGAHQAKNDITATIETWYAMRDKWGLGDADMDEINAISKKRRETWVDLNGKLVYNDNGQETFSFGKHKNSPVEEILEKDPGYIKWIMKSFDFPKDLKMRLSMIEKRMKNSQEKFANS